MAPSSAFDSTSEDPRVLMRLAREGNKQAFSKVYQLYFMPIYRYVFFRVREEALTEDIVQTVFLKVYQSLSRFEDRNVSPLAYFFTVARNALTDYWRKEKEVLFFYNEDGVPSHDVPDLNKGPEEAAIHKEVMGKVYDAFNELTEDQREVLVLRFVNEFSYEEIAKVLGKSEDAVRQLQSRALKAIRSSKKWEDT